MLEDLVYGHEVHAPEIGGALLLETGAAVHGPAEDDRPLPQGVGRLRVGGPEDGHRGHPQGTGDVHEPRVVRDEEIAAGDQRDRIAQGCPAGDVDFVRFDACAGCYYQFTASGMPGDVTIRLQLLAPDGATELPLSPDGGHSWYCTSSGSYFVKVSDHDPRAGAPDHIYSLRINQFAQDTPPPPPPPPAYMPLTVGNLSRDAFPPPPAGVPTWRPLQSSVI